MTDEKQPKQQNDEQQEEQADLELDEKQTDEVKGGSGRYKRRGPTRSQAGESTKARRRRSRR